ncbi:MAG: ABC transporter permease [Verrucomicrobiota bacterium]
MSGWRMVLRGLGHYWRVHLAVFAGVFLTSAILGGALVVGDSVKESLRLKAAMRLAGVQSVLVGGDRFFTEALVDKVAEVGAVSASGIVMVEGSVATADGSVRANRVQMLGVDDSFFGFAGGGEAPVSGERFFAINEALAGRLGVGAGDTVVMRAEIPGVISRDATLSGSSDNLLRRRVEVDAVVGDGEMGAFSLRNEQAPPLTAYLPRAYLQELLEREGRVNVMLVGGDEAGNLGLADIVAQNWTLADASLEMKEIAGGDKWEVSSDRVFLDRELAGAIREVVTPSDGVLTYLVNETRFEDGMTPYSMVAAVETNTAPVIPEDMDENGIVITQWLADDLGVEEGDELSLRFFLPQGGREPEEGMADFVVSGVLPMENPMVNRDWTPDFPGLLEVEDVTGWDPGVDIDNSLIRDKDEDYWDEYRATPKGFIRLRAGQGLWANRFGNLTAIHFLTGQMDEEGLLAALRERVVPSVFGLEARDLAGEAAAAVADSYPFGSLFAGMSFFLMVAALILTALLFAFGVEGRREQIGLFLALGVSRGTVRKWFLVEALVVSVAGALAGILGSVLYTQFALWGLGSMWADAVTGMSFVYSARPISLLIAVVATVLLSVLAVYFSSRALMKVEPRALISGGGESGRGREKSLGSCVSLWLGIVLFAGGVAMLFLPAPSSEVKQGFFLGGGFMLLASGICASALLLRGMALRRKGWRGSLWDLGRTFALTRRGRSMAVIGMMSAGVFMVTALNAMRLNATADAEKRLSGTGGFRYVGESTVPVYEDLNSSAGREELGLGSAEEQPYEVVAMRVSAGDDASCLNLNRAQNPRLLGVAPGALAERGAFPFSGVIGGGEVDGAGESPWLLLDEEIPDGVVPGIVDMNTALYALGKKLGDELEYRDGGGQVFRVKLVGFLANTLLQGSVLISEANFIEKYPDAGGYSYFLLDAPDESVAEGTAKQMSRMLEDRGFAMMPAWQRLAEYNAVRNAYLSIFTTLGGLGILLGTVGLGILVARNVLERRGQLGLMRAVGFERRDLSKLVMAEHWFLHAFGVFIGLGAALVAVSGKLTEAGGDLPLGLLAVMVVVILVAGLFFCWIAARVVVRFPLLESLRSE